MYKITTSGQISLPASVRGRWDTDAVTIEDHGDHVLVRPLPADPIAAARGALKSKIRVSTTELRAQARKDEAAALSRR